MVPELLPEEAGALGEDGVLGVEPRLPELEPEPDAPAPVLPEPEPMLPDPLVLPEPLLPPY